MGRVTELAAGNGGVADCMVSGLVVVCFGTLPVSAPQRDGRAGLVVAPAREFGKDVKLVHGSCTGHFGNLGSPGRMTYSFISPEFELALARLCALEFGWSEEYGAARAGA